MRAWLTLAVRVLTALGFRLACYFLMVWCALWAEARPAPHLPDAVLDVVPYVSWVEQYNYLLWLLIYIPGAVLLGWRDMERFLRYMYSAGFIALVRGVCIMATGLGPVRGADVNAGMSPEARWNAWLQLVTPFGFFNPEGGARVYLTKDLFFSGHTSTTLLLLLYVWKYPALRAVMLVGHAVVVASVFLSHLHYTIDVIGAYAITLVLFTAREGEFGVHRGPLDAGR